MQIDNLLIRACQNGQKGVVASFLKRNDKNLDYVDNNGFSALHYACAKGTRDIIKMLITHGADVNLTSNRGITPLHLAVKTGNKEIIKMLVNEGADINATDNSGESVIIYGIKAGKTDAVRFMKELGADITIADNEGRTAVNYANIMGMAGMIENLLADVENHADSFGNTPLHQSCYNGHSESVKAMLKNPDIEVDAINDAGDTPLSIAVGEGNLYIVELLLEAGANVNRQNNNGESLLHLAARQRKPHLVNTLIKYGADFNARNRNGETPLICAIKSKGAEKGSVDIVELLLEYKAELDCTDIWGNSALYYATEGGSNAIVEMLLEAGATN